MRDMLAWGELAVDTMICGKRIDCDVVVSVTGEMAIAFSKVLVTLNPGNACRTMNVFVEIGDE